MGQTKLGIAHVEATLEVAFQETRLNIWAVFLVNREKDSSAAVLVYGYRGTQW